MAEHSFSFELADTRFVLFEHLRAQRLFELPRFADFAASDVELLLGEAARFSKEIIAPTNEIGDRVGCQFDDGQVRLPPEFHVAYHRQREAGWMAITTESEFGGQGLPFAIGAAVGEIFVGANCSLSMLAGLTRGAAMLLIGHGSEEQKRRYVRPLVEGRWQGTMCLTEPHAGSAVGDITTAAFKRDGRYYLRGQKIFTTGGEHDMVENVIHLVLARCEGAPPGTKGLSLFLVPKIRVSEDGRLGEPNDVTCVGIEEKLGIHGSPTCAMSFGENDNCLGELIGGEEQGIRIMFDLMNGARIGVGLQGVALGGRAYTTALAYAHERIQGVEMKNLRDVNAPRVPIVRHPDVRRMLATMKALVEGCRALLLDTAMRLDLSEHAEDPAERQRAAARVDLLTPICKAYVSDRGFEVASLALQVLGGHGYLRDYPIEQLLRDARIAPIYEGTNGIQALDLLGRKVGREQGALFMSLMADLGGFLEAQKSVEELKPMCAALAERKSQLEQVTMNFAVQQMSGDVDYPLLSATPYLKMFGNVVVGWLLLEQAAIAQQALARLYEEHAASDEAARAALVHDNAQVRFYYNKVKTAAFFASNILTENDALVAAIQSGDRSPLEMHF